MSDKFKSQRSESSNGPEGRFAYIFAHEKRTKRANGSPLKTPRYDVVYLLPKLNADPAQCPNYAYLAKHCMDAATRSWGSFPQGGYWPIQDGDAPPKPKAPAVPGQAVEAPKDYPWRKGHWIVELTNYQDPGPRVAVMQNGQAIEIPARVVNGVAMYKSGDYGIPHMHAYTFHNEKFGVNLGFEGLLFTKQGEPIGSSGPKSAASMFGGIASVASPSVAPPAAPAPQYAQPTATAAPAPQYAAPAAPVAPTYAAPPSPPAAPPMPPVGGAPALPPFPPR